jgi:hypothetical protein
MKNLFVDIDNTLVDGIAPVGGSAALAVPPLPGAVAALHSLARDGWTIYYWTGRWECHRHETLEWLRLWGFPGNSGDGNMFFSLLMVPDETRDYVTEKMHLLSGEPRDGCVIDDMLSYRDAAAEKGYHTIDSCLRDWAYIESAVRDAFRDP